jgi:hypothetical protein
MWGENLRHILKAAAAILGLAAWASLASAASITLHWTAPGDDSLTGRATTYDLRYSTAAITAANFASAIRVPTNQPLPAGSRESYTVSGLLINYPYNFALKTADEAGNWSVMSNVIVLNASTVVGVDDPAGAAAIQFSAPQPNPAHGNTAFTLGLPQAEKVQVLAYDIQGRMVKTIASGTHPAGTERLVWKLDDDSGRPLSTGVYLVRARVGTESFEQRVAVVR